MSVFSEIASVVKFNFEFAQNYKSLVDVKKCKLLQTDIEKDVLFQKYLSLFNDQEERQYHNCNCCRDFLNRYGNVVCLIDKTIGAIQKKSLFDINNFHQNKPEIVFSELAITILHELNITVLNAAINDVFELKAKETKTIGTPFNFRTRPGEVIKFEHFYGNLTDRSLFNYDSNYKNKVESMQANLNSLTDLEIIDKVIQLAEDNQIYRGATYVVVLKSYKETLVKYNSRSQCSISKTYFLWLYAENFIPIKNTAIGTFLQDLHEGVDEEDAIKKFEKLVAPENYKRPTAIITPAMVDKMKEELQKENLLDSLNRRVAVLEDVPLDNVLFYNVNAVKEVSTNSDDIFDSLKNLSATNIKKEKLKSISLEQFFNCGTKDIQFFLENQHTNNCVTLITAENPETTSLFSWNNQFSWSYNKSLADASFITEKVKSAGGVVDAPLRISLSWENIDDLDLSIRPKCGNAYIFYGKPSCSSIGGILDIDMNAREPYSNSPVENIYFPSLDKLKTKYGRYNIVVHNFRKRTAGQSTFTLEVSINGEITQITRNSPFNNEYITVGYIEVEDGKIKVIIPKSKTNSPSKSLWGLQTQNFHPISLICKSPNFWGNQKKGNEHLFFFLSGMQNTESPRAFFNEFLSENLLTHRKALEHLGGKLKVKDKKPNGLHGVGFSVSQKFSFIVKIDKQLYLVENK